MKKWEWFWFGSGAYIIIDNRIQCGVDYLHWKHNNKLALKENQHHKWTPLCKLDYSERFTKEEFEHLAETIVDRLNAVEVEKKLKGES